MPIRTISSQSRSSLIEPLEPRIAPAATALSVGRALDLADGTTIVLSGNPASIATMKLPSTGQLLGFPSGSDGDFLVLSTGVASHLTSWANTGSAQGTDLGPIGADGDSASVTFVIPVPEGAAGRQRFKLDFMFLSEEFPEYAGALFNDQLTILINGVNYAVDSQGNAMEVDNTYFTGAPATGTYFDGRSEKVTLSYAVPEGVTSLTVEIRISDVGDGQVDSAVIVDNVRFQSQETIFLDFGGETLNDHFGAGLNAILPEFKPEDVGSSMDREELIDLILSRVREKFSAYDIMITGEQPFYSEHGTVVIGGNNNLPLNLSNANPLLRDRFPTGEASLRDVYGLGNDSLLGFSGSPDIGNLDHNDKAVIFSGEFAGFFAGASSDELINHLVVTIAHEIGHNLGLRHTTDDHPSDIMSQTAPRMATATFGNSLIALAEQWSDGTMEQNAHSYLLSVLGGSGQAATGLFTSVVTSTLSFVPRLAQTIYNATIHISLTDGDGRGFTYHFEKLDGTQSIKLPLVPTDAKISIYGASTPGGDIDFYTGAPTGGILTDADIAVPLFDANGRLATIPVTKKQASGVFVPIGSIPVLENQMGNVKIIPSKVATFIDDDGDFYTIKLTGPGLLGYVLDDPDLNGQGAMSRLVLQGTTFSDSSLTITVLKKGPNGDGRVNIGEITGTLGSGLKTLSAPAADIVGGGVVFSGALGSITLRDLVNGADLIGGSADKVKTNIKLHAVGDGSEISLGTAVGNFQAARIGDASITMASLVKLTVTGDRAVGLAPDLGAQIHIAGTLGSLSVGDLTGTASLEAGGSPLDRTVLAMRSVADGVHITLASTVTSLKATAIGEAIFSAQQFDSVILTGALEGDFIANGKIGRFTATDLASTASLTAGGLAKDRTTLTFQHLHDGATISLESTIQTFKATKVDNVSISAAAMGTLQITGNVRAGLAGDFAGNLVLSGGEDAFKNVLTKAIIAGSLINASIVAESIGTFTVGSIKHSTIFVGYSPVMAAQALNGGVFFEGSEIKSLTVRSATNGFENSVIAAKSFGTVRIVSVNFDNTGEEFGLLTKTPPTRVNITGFAYNKTGPADQSQGDFHLRLIG